MIDSVGGFVQHNLVVFVATVLLPLKWGVVRIRKDTEAEAVTLMSVPEDICYVALGLVLGDVINSAGSFRRYFAGSAHITTDVSITVGITKASPCACIVSLRRVQISSGRGEQLTVPAQTTRTLCRSDWSRLYAKTVEGEVRVVQSFARRVLAAA